MSTTDTTQTSQPKIKLTVTMILADLNNGLDRKAIRAKYGLSASDTTRLFQHEKLKGARVRVAPAFELEDDTESLVKETPSVKPRKKAEPKTQPAIVEDDTVQESVINEASPVVEPLPLSEDIELPVIQTEEAAKEDSPIETKVGLW